jgi:hypothetical protein
MTGGCCKAFLASARAAAERGLALGALSDASEELSSALERQLVLRFPVLAASSGALLSPRGVCRVTLRADGRARRVHAFFERDDGSVVDLLVETRDDDSPPTHGAKPGLCFFDRKKQLIKQKQHSDFGC